MSEERDPAVRALLESRDFWRAVIVENIGNMPKREDLVRQWDQVPPDAMDQRFPGLRARDVLISSYWNWAFTKAWAREGLQQLMAKLIERREPIPRILQDWAVLFAAGRLESLAQRGRKEQWNRNVRTWSSVRLLRGHGYTQQAAVALIADALRCSEENVRSVVRKVENARPFDKPKRSK